MSHSQATADRGAVTADRGAVDDICSLPHPQSTVKTFELLCCLKEVDLNNSDLFTTAKQLQ